MCFVGCFCFTAVIACSIGRDGCFDGVFYHSSNANANILTLFLCLFPDPAPSQDIPHRRDPVIRHRTGVPTAASPRNQPGIDRCAPQPPPRSPGLVQRALGRTPLAHTSQGGTALLITLRPQDAGGRRAPCTSPCPPSGCRWRGPAEPRAWGRGGVVDTRTVPLLACSPGPFLLS